MRTYNMIEINNPYIFIKTDLEELGLSFDTVDDIKFAMKVKAFDREDFMNKMREYIRNTAE
jgi:hypothetical protein